MSLGYIPANSLDLDDVTNTPDELAAVARLLSQHPDIAAMLLDPLNPIKHRDATGGGRQRKHRARKANA